MMLLLVAWLALLSLILFGVGWPLELAAGVKDKAKSLVPQREKKEIEPGYTSAGYRKGYDPHYTRSMEIKEFGEGFTTCPDEECLTCHPKVSKPVIAETASPYKRVVGSVDVDYFRPNWVPEYADIDMLYDRKGQHKVIRWTWYQNGKRLYHTSTLSLVEGYEIISGDGTVIKTVSHYK